MSHKNKTPQTPGNKMQKEQEHMPGTKVSGGRIVSAVIIAVIILLMTVCFLGYLFFTQTRKDAIDTGKDFLQTLSEYHPVNVEETVEKDLTYILEEHRTNLNLELVRRTVTGTIDKVYNKNYRIHIPGLYDGNFRFDGYAEIRCPVTYSYYVSLDGKWKILIKNSIVSVYAPRIEAGNPQIETSRLRERFEGSAIVFDREKLLKDLRSGLTRELKVIGEEQKNVSYVREDCRRQIEKFVRTWLLGMEEVGAVIVFFEDDEDLLETAGISERNQEYLEIRRNVR